MMTRAGCLLIVLMFCASCARPSAAERIRRDTLSAAKTESKSALLVFSMKGSIWCELLEQFHSDQEAWGVLGKHFVIGRVDIDETEGGLQMLVDRGFSDAPAFVILDQQGNLLSNSSEGGLNFGFPNDDDEVARYVAAIQVACPQITEDEIGVLRRKLEEMRQPE